jgi:AraC-like DNA-binding protein
MPLEVRRDGTLVFGYLDTDSPDRHRAHDTVLIRASGPYSADMRPQRFGPLQACDISGEHTVRVSPHSRSGGASEHLLGLLLAGDGSLEQDGRRCALSPGDFVLYAGGRPFHLDLSSGYRWFLLALDPGTAQIARRVGDAVANQELPRVPSGRILASMLTELAHRAPDLGPVTRNEMGEHVSGIIRTLVRDFGGRRSPDWSGPGPRQILDEVVDHIEAHLAEPLTPAGIAAAHHMSVRSLHVLFQRRGETVGEYVRRRRLDRIRRDLADPELAHLPAYAVAARWGVPDPSHFTKLFKAEFGVSPREFRHRLHAEPDDRPTPYRT